MVLFSSIVWLPHGASLWASLLALSQVPGGPLASPPPNWDMPTESTGSAAFVAAGADSPTVPGEFLVMGAPSVDLAELIRGLEASGMQAIGGVPSLRLLRVRATTPVGQRLSESSLRQIPGVASVEPHGLGRGGLIVDPPNDTHFAAQWHHENPGMSGAGVGADVESREAWDLSQGDVRVRIAVLDSGIFPSSPEFAGRLDPGYDFVGEDSDPTADHPHGPRVTSLLAANANNNFGVTGMDWNCRIVPVKVLNSNNAGTVFDLIQGLDFCTQEQVDVVSMSLVNYPGSSALNAAIEAARDAGCILISCGSNLGSATILNPGANPLTIAIGASTRLDRRANFSGWGPELDFIAPGADMPVPGAPGDGVRIFSGCSAATPVAAGIVGLLIARNLILDQDQAYELLRLGAEDQVGPPSEDTPGRDDFFGHGRLNARRSLEALELDPSLIGYSCTPAVPNTSGNSAHITARGNVATFADDLVLGATGLPTSTFGYFLMGEGTNVIVPVNSIGNLCIVGGRLLRVAPPILDSGTNGTFEFASGTLSVPGLGAILPGETWGFQAWFRDGSNLSNFSDSLRVTFR